MSEARMVAAVIATLNLQRGVLAFRCNTGVARLHGSHVRYGLGNGAPDVLAVLAPFGHLIGLEGKLPGRDLDPEQDAWRRELQAHGGSFGVFRSVAEALAIVAAIRSSLHSADIALSADCTPAVEQSSACKPLRPWRVLSASDDLRRKEGAGTIERAAQVNVEQGQCKASHRGGSRR